MLVECDHFIYIFLLENSIYLFKKDVAFEASSFFFRKMIHKFTKRDNRHIAKHLIKIDEYTRIICGCQHVHTRNGCNVYIWVREINSNRLHASSSNFYNANSCEWKRCRSKKKTLASHEYRIKISTKWMNLNLQFVFIKIQKSS